MKASFVATGDSFSTRRIPQNYPGRKELQAFLEKHDVKFNNLETTYHYEEGYPSAFSGGTWAIADPVVLDDINDLGFNIYNTANNHSMDFLQGGLMATAEHLKERDMLFAGTGANLYEASKAVYLDTDECRVALIGITSDFHDSDIAGEQGPAMMGRPGLNGLRVNTTYFVTKDYYDMLESLVKETKMNSYAEYGVKLGYVKPAPAGNLAVGGMKFRLAEETRIDTQPHPKDLERTLQEIREAKLQADYVMVSVHTHAGSQEDYLNPPQFMEVFARKCIEAGADVILGHGPHELRGIEIYQGKPIFYSLGNFIFQTETVAKQPAEAFTGKGFPADMKVGEYMEDRSAHGTRGYGIMPSIWFSVIPSWEMEDGVVKEIRLYPMTLGMELPRSRKGLPKLVRDDSILEYIQKLSSIYGTKIEIEDGIGVIRL